jgi:formylmethanofuran dehydrogenase subunit E
VFYKEKKVMSDSEEDVAATEVATKALDTETEIEVTEAAEPVADAEETVEITEPTVLSAYLLKITSLTRAIGRRHFSILESGKLVQGLNSTDGSKTYALTCESSVSVVEDARLEYEFEVVVSSKKSLKLLASSPAERDAWIQAIQSVIPAPVMEEKVVEVAEPLESQVPEEATSPAV